MYFCSLSMLVCQCLSVCLSVSKSICLSPKTDKQSVSYVWYSPHSVEGDQMRGMEETIEHFIITTNLIWCNGLLIPRLCCF